jgi:hypothetical protein
MDISKYLTNKDVSISNDDIDLEKLTTDLRKGYIEEKSVESKIKEATADYENRLKTAKEEATAEATKWQNSYDDLNNKYTEQANQLKSANLRVAISEAGFNSSDSERVQKLRTTYYGDIENDAEAVQKMKEQFGKVYFEQKQNQAPNESGFSKGGTKEPDVVITRNTSIKDLIRKKII